MISNLKRDEPGDLRRWPVLVDDNWQAHMEEPCAVLFGRSQPSKNALGHIAGLRLSSHWPRMEQFYLGSNLIVLAHGYSQFQALLFAEDANRQLREIQSPDKSDYSLTWGIAIPEAGRWSLSAALSETISLSRRAEEDGRFGSINVAEAGWQSDPHTDLVVYAEGDGLTGLPTWRSVAALRLHLNNEPLMLLMGDVDGIKRYNDVMGILMGDAALEAVAEVLYSFQSPDVAAFRLGGDEFMLWARGVSVEEAQAIAESVNAQLSEETISIPGAKSPLSALLLTWGVVSSTDAPLETMLRQADELMLAAKAEGRRGTVNS